MITIILGSSEYAEEVYKSYYHSTEIPCYHTPEGGLSEAEQVEYIKGEVQEYGSMVVYTHSAVVLAQFQLFVLIGLIPVEEMKILFVDAEGIHEVPIDGKGRIKTPHPISGKVFNQLCEELIGF